MQPKPGTGTRVHMDSCTTDIRRRRYLLRTSLFRCSAESNEGSPLVQFILKNLKSIIAQPRTAFRAHKLDTISHQITSESISAEVESGRSHLSCCTAPSWLFEMNLRIAVALETSTAEPSCVEHIRLRTKILHPATVLERLLGIPDTPTSEEVLLGLDQCFRSWRFDTVSIQHLFLG